jgi:hypothetical protein
MRLRALFLTIVVCALLRTEAHALYREDRNSAMWSRGALIPVCWKPGINPEDGLRKRIRAAVEDTWGRYSSIGFTGWGNCPTTTVGGMVGQHGIFIEPSTGASSSYTGKQFTAQNQPIPTLMSLNFNAPVASLCDIGPGGNSNDDCVTWTAIHEFGHALSFKHEHARHDFQECTMSRLNPGGLFNDKRSGGGVALTTYDGASVMNYCAPNGNGAGQLTWKDVAGLQSVYGLKPRGSIVGPGGRCVDVDNSNLGNGSAVQLWECWDGPNQRWSWSVTEGLFRTHSNGACLDDANGGTQPGTGVDVWQCENRAVPRWNFGQFYLQGMGNKCIDVDSNGRVNFTGCRFGAAFQWTYTPQGQIQRFRSNACLVFGGLGTQPSMTTCDPNRLDQQVYLTASGTIVSSQNELCLDVPDNPPYTMNKLPIRMAECNTGKLTQKFYFSGLMKTNAGLCMSHVPTDISRNGVRVTNEQCSTRTVFWDFYAF